MPILVTSLDKFTVGLLLNFLLLKAPESQALTPDKNRLNATLAERGGLWELLPHGFMGKGFLLFDDYLWGSESGMRGGMRAEDNSVARS